MEDINKFEDLWIDIEENFEWKKVYTAMKALDWHWYIADEKFGIPDISTIKKFAYQSCYEAFTRGGYYSGGFKAKYKNKILTLSFILTDWTTE